MEEKTFYMYKISNLLNISKIVTVHYQKLVKTYSFPKEKHDFWEIIYCDKNSIFVTIEDDKRLLKRGEIIFIAPNRVHAVECDGAKDPNIFIVSFECKSKTMAYFTDKCFCVP